MPDFALGRTRQSSHCSALKTSLAKKRLMIIQFFGPELANIPRLWLQCANADSAIFACNETGQK